MRSERTDSPRTIEEAFRGFADRDFIFAGTPGNWGDRLIKRGAEALATRLGLRWRSVAEGDFETERLPERCVVYLHGGGGFNSWCSGRAPRLLAHALRSHAGPLIQGPQSVEPTSAFLEGLRQRVLAIDTQARPVFFVRERTSFDALARCLPAWIDLRLDHDTAFSLTRDDLVGPSVRLRPRYDLLAFRQDNEAPMHVGAVDRPGVRLDPAYFATTFEHWLRIHACARSILTNRTHSAIAGAILGIPTTLLPGSYHKNRSIWEYSLADRGVKWSEWPPPRPCVEKARRKLTESPRLRYVLDSYRVQRAAMRLRGVPLS